MPIAVVVLSRRVVLSKDEWRTNCIRRTLDPIDAEPLLLKSWQGDGGVIEVHLEPDGTAAGPPVNHALAGRQRVSIGVLELESLDDNSVKVTLREDLCARLLGVPRRPTRQLALLEPSKPVRVLLNGRTSNYSGQYYVLLDYHIMLQAENVRVPLPPLLLIDLQADLS